MRDEIVPIEKKPDDESENLDQGLFGKFLGIFNMRN